MPTPPAGAARKSVTVPVAELPPVTDVGERLTPPSSDGSIVKVADFVPVPNAAAIVAATLPETTEVVIVNVAELAPAGIVSVEGIEALVLLELNLIVMPPAGAVPLRVTVPVEDNPPTTADGETVRPPRLIGLMVSEADLVEPPMVVAIVAVTLDETAEVPTEKVAEVAPAGTVTDPGTFALELLDDSETTIPLGPAGPLRVIVPVEELPPNTEVGLSDRLEIVAASTVKGAWEFVSESIAVMTAS